MKKIALHRSNGSIAAYTFVDDQDYTTLAHYSWCLNGHGYVVRYQRYGGGRRKVIAMHREIMGAMQGQIVDHINGNPLINLRSNLRFCTKSQNGMNRGKPRNNTSGRKNVYWSRQAGKWFVKFVVLGKQITVGFYDSVDEATAAAKEHVVINHGRFAHLEATCAS